MANYFIYPEKHMKSFKLVSGIKSYLPLNYVFEYNFSSYNNRLKLNYIYNT